MKRYRGSNGEKVRILGSKLTYNLKNSRHELSDIQINEGFIAIEGLNKIVSKLKSLLEVEIMPNDKRCKYYEWDEETFQLPKEYLLNENSELTDALKVFFAAGGYDFFDVENPKYYADGWLEFVGDLFSAIIAGKYHAGNSTYKNPLSDEQKQKLIERKVPNIFTQDIE